MTPPRFLFPPDLTHLPGASIQSTDIQSNLISHSVSVLHGRLVQTANFLLLLCLLFIMDIRKFCIPKPISSDASATMQPPPNRKQDFDNDDEKSTPCKLEYNNLINYSIFFFNKAKIDHFHSLITKELFH